MRLGFSLAIKRGMAPELSMMRLAFLKNSLINKKRVRRGGAKYNSGLINKKWVRSGRAISAIQSVSSRSRISNLAKKSTC